MKIVMGSPVKGLKLKTALKEYLRTRGHEIVDVGCDGDGAFVKYPSVGERVAHALQQGAGEVAISVTSTAMRVCGGAAFSKHLNIERLFRDAHAGAVMAPTGDVLREFIGKSLLGIPLF